MTEPFGVDAAKAWEVLKTCLAKAENLDLSPLRSLPPRYEEKSGVQVAFECDEKDAMRIGSGLSQILRWAVRITKSDCVSYLRVMRGWEIEKGKLFIIISEDKDIFTGKKVWP